MLRADQVELVGVAVVVPAGLTKRRTAALGLAAQHLGVRGDTRDAGPVPWWREQVDPERDVNRDQRSHTWLSSAVTAASAL